MAPLALLLLACDADHGHRTVTAELAGCGDWETVGQPALLESCTGCHSAGLAGEARHGAPEGVDLDTLAGARAWAEAAAEQVGDGLMPPGGGMSEDEATALLQWLSCGAPGEESDLPTFATPTGLLGAAETRVSAALEEDGALVLYADLSGGDLEGRVGPWSEERYQLDEAEARLISRTRYDAEGAVELAESWDPPLLLWGGTSERWTQDSVLTRQSAAGEILEDQRWEATLGADESPDPRQTDQDASRLTLTRTEPAAGEGTLTLSWDLSPTLSFVKQECLIEAEDGSQHLESHQQLTVAWPFEGLPEFPLGEDVEWMGRMLLTEEAP